MSKEDKLAKKEAKAAKKAAKAEKAAAKCVAAAEKKHAKAYAKFVKKTNKKNTKGEKKKGAEYAAIAIPAIEDYQSKAEVKAIKAGDKAYDKLVKKINKKNAKMEKKCAKKGKPFVPIAIPEREDMVYHQNKKKKVIRMIILILLIWLLIYFIVMWINYVGDTAPVSEETTASQDANYDYEAYSNPHEITTTPNYTIADAKNFLKQVIHDNYKEIGYSSDVSNSSITYSNKTVTVNNADCYVFTCSGKTYAVSVKLSACYVEKNGEYSPLTFNNTEYLFND